MIGTLRETELHAALKRHYARPHDQLEVALDGYIADIVRADGEIVDVVVGAMPHDRLSAKVEWLLSKARGEGFFARIFGRKKAPSDTAKADA